MRKTKLIYFGEGDKYRWRVKVSPAKKNVVINGHAMHALKGHAGVTVGCALSYMAMDKANSEAFPHPVILAAITKTTALIVDKLDKNGQPAHAVAYEHSHGKFVDMNDECKLKELVKKDPSIMDRPFKLSIPRQQVARIGTNAHGDRIPTNTHKNIIHRGALARAEKSGLIPKNLAAIIKDQEAHA